MGCTECDNSVKVGNEWAYYRIGNKEIGWGNIALVGCRKHISLALETLNRNLEDGRYNNESRHNQEGT